MVVEIIGDCVVEWGFEEEEGCDDFDEPRVGFVRFESVVMGNEGCVGNLRGEE